MTDPYDEFTAFLLAEPGELRVAIFRSDGEWTRPDRAKDAAFLLVGAGGGASADRDGEHGQIMFRILPHPLPESMTVTVGRGGRGAGGGGDGAAGLAFVVTRLSVPEEKLTP